MKIATALIALLFGLLAAGSAVSQGRPVSISAHCAVEGAPPGSRCGTIQVPEDRARPRGRLLSLRFVVVPGGKAAPADPIFYIAGGPGESAVESLPPVLQTLRSVDPGREIVFLDQRGTGGSNRLGCPNGLDLLGALYDEAGLRDCFARLRERAAPGLYSSANAVADLEDLRAALGYGRVNLVGVSYGVRVALLYMQGHPQKVRSAVLRSAYPLDLNIIAEGSAAADAALVQVLEDCERDSACQEAFPRLRDQLRILDARLASSPAAIDIGGTAGAPARMEVTRDLFHFLLLAMMQASTSRQYVPLLIATAATEGFQPFATTFSQLRNGIAALPVGMYLSVICGEDFPRLQRSPAPKRSVFLITAAKLERACSLWPVKPAAAERLGSFRSDVPTLVISGALDPVTPAQAGARLAALSARAAHIVLPATAHGPMFPDCVRPTVAAFFRTAAATSADGACAALALPPFALPAVATPAPAAAAGAAAVAGPIQGTWDLQWQTPRGSSPGGYLVIRQSGNALEADLHGRGSIRASGRIAGSGFTLSGQRLFVPYTITGTVDGDRIEGVLKVMSIERTFVGVRRTLPTPGATKPGGRD
jgi:pimeloyl-ACP methyl ester carboxylesterase